MLNQITEKIYQIQLPLFINASKVNCYLIKGDNGYTILDTGDNLEESKKLWTTVLQGKKVEKVVITHAHPDHVGLSRWFQEQFSVPIFVSKKSNMEIQKTKRYLQDINENPAFAFLKQHGGPELPPSALQRRIEDFDFEPDEIFDETKTLVMGDDEYKILETPGHSPDHICFYDPNTNLLFGGDHILGNINTVVLTENPKENSLKDYLHSLSVIENYPISFILPGHGDSFSNVTERIQRIKQYYKNRWNKILNLLGEGEASAYELVVKQRGPQNIVDKPSAAPFIQMITNLTYLESIHILSRRTVNGIDYFYKNPTSTTNIEDL